VFRYSVSVLAFFGLTLALFSHLPEAQAKPPRQVTLLTINDVYRIDGLSQGKLGGIDRIRGLRRALEKDYPELLLLHAGDFLFPSMLSRRYEGMHMVDLLNGLDGDFSIYDPRLIVTFGNHEFDKSENKNLPMLIQRLTESQFPWLGSNIRFKSSGKKNDIGKHPNLYKTLLKTVSGVKVGIFSLTTNIKHPQYVDKFDDPDQTALSLTATLRSQGAEVVIALTHQMVDEDKKLLQRLGDKGPDLIVGGHEHNKQVHRVDGRLIIKADADAITVGLVTITLPESDQESLKVESYFIELNEDIKKDPLLKSRVDWWKNRFNQDHCKSQNQEADCLDKKLTTTQVRLIAEELEIRMYETNFGSWIVDQARDAFKKEKAQIAFINSGSLRLNQNIEAGTPLTQRYMEELFAYDNNLSLIKIDGKTLKKIVAHSVEEWGGIGQWLQISGFAFRFDPKTGQTSQLSLLTEQGSRLITDDETLFAVTNDFLLNPAYGQDGFTMITPDMIVPTENSTNISLKALVIKALEETPEGQFSPKLQGLICNTQRAGPCLAKE
jgi:2',3'-cyclic-nucleotide 2'-phosphodiesterase (5'-nucleotidase family)